MQNNNKAIRASLEEKTKVEQISETLPHSSNCSTNSLSFSRCKTKLSLTEAEREAMRVRRVLANRESARQTIRRRKAFRDGLAKKVSDLSLVNQSMKIEKGQITKEYMSLRNKNKQLKTELAMAITYNTISAESSSPPLESSSSPTENSFLINTNPPCIPCIFPSWPPMTSHSVLCYNRTTELQTPCVWFCTLLDQIAVSRHLLSSNRKEKEVDLLPGCSTTTLAEEKRTLQEQNQRENVVTHAPSPSKDKTMKVDKSHQLDIDLNSLTVTPEPSFDALNHCSSIGDEPVRTFSDRSDRFFCASVAASARRRRKEILKLKHLCGRPMVLHV